MLFALSNNFLTMNRALVINAGLLLISASFTLKVSSHINRVGVRGGLQGVVAPLSEHATPGRKVKNYFVGDFWHLQYPESRILAPSSEESAPCRKLPGATPAYKHVLKSLNL